MKGHLSVDTPAAAPAGLVWDAFRGVELARYLNELLGDVIGRAEVVEGDGGVGTVVKVTFAPGTPGPGYWKEIFRIMDDEKRVKAADVIEGGLIELGFDQYRVRFEVIEKDAESSIIRSTIEYELEDSKKELASLVSTEAVETLAERVGKYLAEKNSTPKNL
ncbi:hypothetical protein Tsubulata_019448 [Turnera subulata]|uniref:Bet v I/Major latex protein domain-containing protein n=1 Tax=Turnera subulata TaxID=218843 RepID=A0A9Q0FAU1_9ROSI|nr:hypothetical protein Tsubulata_019448 [Turnera subulata]